MKLVEAQMLTSFARVLTWHAKVVSGAVTRSTRQRGVEGGGWRDLTPEEKIDDGIATMDRHVQRMQECEDYIGQNEYKEK